MVFEKGFNCIGVLGLYFFSIIGLGCNSQDEVASVVQPGNGLEEKIDQIDELFSDWNGDRPGGGVAVLNNRSIVYEGYFGMANIEKSEPFTESSITDIGSISKQFTTFSIALLEEEGKLNVDDDIRDYLPEMPDYGTVITIKNLIFHTSGIKDHEELVKLKGLEPYGEHMNNGSAIRMIANQKSLNFAPGSEYEYSNANYVLLAEIVARVSGMAFSTFAKENIFKPLGMVDSFFNLNQGDDFENRAWGYIESENGYERPVYDSHIVGDGGVYTTLRDFVKWDANFLNNVLGKTAASLTERMKYREPLIDGAPNFMAFAQIETMHPFGKTSWSHGGSGGGYRSFYIRFEDPSFSVIVLGNGDENNAFGKANEIVDIFLNDAPSVPQESMTSADVPPIVSTIKLTSEEKKQFIGYYYNEEARQVVGITFNDQEQVFNVNWFDSSEAGYLAVAKDSKTLVEQDDATQEYVLNVDTGTLTNRIGNRVGMILEKLEPFSGQLVDYAGRYYSSELEYEFSIIIQVDRLSSGNRYVSEARPISNTLFFDPLSKVIMTFGGESLEGDLAVELDIPLGDRSLRHMRFVRINP